MTLARSHANCDPPCVPAAAGGWSPLAHLLTLVRAGAINCEIETILVKISKV